MNWKNQYEKKSVWGRFKSWMWVQTKRVMIIALLIGSGYVVAFVHISKAEVEFVDREVIKEVEVSRIPAVMERIAKCESGGTHYRNGQVIFNGNTNKSVDIGKYQINSVWNATATKMGLDLTKEKDNEAFAMHIYHTRGTEDWYSSKACWNK